MPYQSQNMPVHLDSKSNCKIVSDFMHSDVKQTENSLKVIQKSTVIMTAIINRVSNQELRPCIQKYLLI